MMVVAPQVDDDAISAALDKVNHYITERGGNVIRQEPWGRLRKLAYPIKNQTEGNYVLTYLELEPEHTNNLEASILLSADFLRHMLVKVDAIPVVKEQPPQLQAEPAVAASPETPTEDQAEPAVAASPETPTEDQAEPAVAASPETPTEDQAEPAVAASPETPTEDQAEKKEEGS
jgi:small subunit ribosomal protein S6